jgi:hypothetical protein
MSATSCGPTARVPLDRASNPSPLAGPIGVEAACRPADNVVMDEEQENAAPVAPPDVYLIPEAGFTPVFPKVGEPMTYYWSEANRGGEHPEPYHARVVWKNDDQIIDDVSVECTPLATNGSAYRTTELSTPTQAGIGYSIELWADVDHHSNFSEGYNYAYHTLSVDD